MAIQEILKESWNNLRRAWVKLLVLNVVVFGAAFLLALVLILVLGVGVIGNLGAIQNDPSVLLKLIGPFAVVIAIFVVVFIVLSLIVQAGTILLLGTDKKYSLGDLVKMGVKLALPLFCIGLIGFLLTLPALFLFIIPGLLVSLFFMFGAYELVLNERGALESLGRSAYLVKNNFGYVFARVLVILGLSILVWIIGASFGREGGGLISWIINMIFGWYVQSYAIVLYKDLESKTKDKKASVGLIPFVVLAVLGYIAAGAIGYSVAKLVTNPEFQKGFNQGYSNSIQESPDFKDLYNLENLDNVQ